jgi:hypothetical protein
LAERHTERQTRWPERVRHSTKADGVRIWSFWQRALPTPGSHPHGQAIMSGLAATAGFVQFRLMSSHSPHPSAAAVSFLMKTRTGDRGQFPTFTSVSYAVSQARWWQGALCLVEGAAHAASTSTRMPVPYSSDASNPIVPFSSFRSARTSEGVSTAGSRHCDLAVVNSCSQGRCNCST